MREKRHLFAADDNKNILVPFICEISFSPINAIRQI